MLEEKRPWRTDHTGCNKTLLQRLFLSNRPARRRGWNLRVRPEVRLRKPDPNRPRGRILRPGGTLFAAGISRFASAIDGVMQDFLADPVFGQIVERDLTDGQHRNPTNHPGYFTTAYFHRPQDLLDEVLEAGFGEAQILGVEGLGWALPQLDDVLEDEAARRRLFDILRRLETEPALLGASPHLLAIARRNEIV